MLSPNASLASLSLSLSLSCLSVFRVGAATGAYIKGSISSSSVSQSVSHCGFAGDGNVCDRKSRRFAIAIFGALTV